MEQGRLYYLWLYLPDRVKLPPYSRTKKRRKEIYDMILKSVQAGEAKLYQAGLYEPEEVIRKSNGQIENLHLFTSVVLKYFTTTKIDFSLGDEALIKCFVDLFRESEEVIIIGDNIRMLIDTEEYRQVTLEGRKRWLPSAE